MSECCHRPAGSADRGVVCVTGKPHGRCGERTCICGHRNRKAYLAAFDSAKYERVLFVAHREEILKQAAVSFKNVRNSEDYGFFDGKEKDRDKSVIFASVATLGRTEYLNETYFRQIILTM